MKKAVIIVILCHIFIMCKAELHFAYYSNGSGYQIGEKFAALVRKNLLNKYGRDWFFNHYMKFSRIEQFHLWFGKGDVLLIAYRKCNKRNQDEDIDHIVLFNEIKSIVDSLAMQNDTLYSVMPYDRKLKRTELSELAQVEMSLNPVEFIFGYCPWNYAAMYLPGPLLDCEGQMFFGYEWSGGFNPLHDKIGNEYKKACKEKGYNIIKSTSFFSKDYTKEEIDLYLDYLCAYDDVILNLKPAGKIYFVPFTYTAQPEFSEVVFFTREDILWFDKTN